MSAAANKVRQSESPYERAMADISESTLHRYRKFYRPVENKFMGRVDQMDRPGQYALAGGLAEASLEKQFDPSLRSDQEKTIAAGLAPNSGAFIARQAALRGTAGDAMAQAGVSAKLGQRSRHLAGMGTVVGMGHGQGGEAQASLSSLAATSAARAKADVQNQWETDAATAGALGTAIGAGVSGAMRKWGN
jgi:hypothetical protein